MLTPPSIEADRVRRNTASSINRRIDATTLSRIRFYASQPQAAINQRIADLEREWDIERVLETNAAALALTGIALGTRVNRRWYALSAVILSALLLHGVQGWCPPVPILRRLGVRTQSEIDREKLALKCLRTDKVSHEPPPRVRRRIGALVAEN